MTGTVKTLLSEKKCGFIAGEDGQDYFFHASGLANCGYEDLTRGAKVTFDPTKSPKGPRAERVTQ